MKAGVSYNTDPRQCGDLPYKPILPNHFLFTYFQNVRVIIHRILHFFLPWVICQYFTVHEILKVELEVSLIPAY